jgi:hypothetical protein
MLRPVDVVILAIPTYLIYDRIKNYGQLYCSTNIEIWLIGLYFITLSLSCILIIVLRWNNIPQAVVTFGLLFISFQNVFIFLWNVFGTIWLVKNLQNENKCLSSTSVILLLTLQIIIYSLYIMVVIVSCCENLFGNITVIENLTLEGKLIKMYKEPQYMLIHNINEFIAENELLLESKGILEIESRIIMSSFTTKVIKLGNIDMCVICLCDFVSDSLKSNIACRHHFHFDCLMSWLRIKPRCPICQLSFRIVLLKTYYANRGINFNS